MESLTLGKRAGVCRQWIVAVVLTGFALGAVAQNAERSLSEWLDRLHDASQRMSYIGTFVVSAGSDIAASKIWHVCDGNQQVERIEALSGTSRTTLRRNDEVLTLLPDNRVAVQEKREALRLFPALLKTPGQSISQFYAAQSSGFERVAGFEADVVDFVPRDRWRFGYRLWSERKSGLVLKLQTRDASGQVLEQVAFTDLQLNAPISMDKLTRQMAPPSGYQVVKAVQRKTSLDEQGWRVKTLAPGFQPVSCHVRGDAGARLPPVLQCVFSDGLASLSWFVEPYDSARHVRERLASSGATHYLAKRLGGHWVTVMGEVPPETLRQFVGALEPVR